MIIKRRTAQGRAAPDKDHGPFHQQQSSCWVAKAAGFVPIRVARRDDNASL